MDSAIREGPAPVSEREATTWHRESPDTQPLSVCWAMYRLSKKADVLSLDLWGPRAGFWIWMASNEVMVGGRSRLAVEAATVAATTEVMSEVRRGSGGTSSGGKPAATALLQTCLTVGRRLRCRAALPVVRPPTEATCVEQVRARVRAVGRYMGWLGGSMGCSMG